ncbi:TAXI family TRAP transporter solute-binding subunit [Halomonas sp. AOP35-4E-18]|uniref:TAXI family TRAP transporter solute-binding subunit n=1 Tax=Halomonas sp. AOP35-4E-18 TaxID=3457686 RepID=UPI00403482D4
MRVIRYALAASAIAIAPLAAAQQISIATGGTGGTYYPYGGGLAELINKYLAGYNAVAEGAIRTRDPRLRRLILSLTDDLSLQENLPVKIILNQ